MDEEAGPNENTLSGENSSSVGGENDLELPSNNEEILEPILQNDYNEPIESEMPVQDLSPFEVEDQNEVVIEEDQDVEGGIVGEEYEVFDVSDESSESEDVDEDDEVMEEDFPERVRVINIRRGLLNRIPGMLRRLGRLPFFGNVQSIEDIDDDGSDNESRNAERPESITFDKRLPTSHSYLGEMNDCSGIPYIDDESFVTIPILRVADFLLVPGQTMPLNIIRPQEVSLLKSVLARPDKTFGVIWINTHGLGSSAMIDFGCTAELRSIREEEVHEVQTMVGIAVGRQRFKLMEKRPQPDGNLVGKVQILNDDEFSPPASGARLGVHYKHAIPTIKSAKRRHFLNHPGWLTSSLPWMYNMYDVIILRKLLIQELKEWNPDLDEKSLPTSPSAFSFWIASHLLITNTMRLFLLQIDCSIQRMRCELDLLKKCTIYACMHCGNHITEKKHLFNMSVSGPMDAYVNPSGHIHETLTVYLSQGLVRVSRPSTEHSWFPGYAWTICECASCGRHMGWKFTATKDSLTPKNFWGLTRSSLSPKFDIEDSSEKTEQVGRRRRLTSNDSSNSSGSMSSRVGLNWRPMM
ncbi:protein cereblon-like [Styela clava]